MGFCFVLPNFLGGALFEVSPNLDRSPRDGKFPAGIQFELTPTFGRTNARKWLSPSLGLIEGLRDFAFQLRESDWLNFERIGLFVIFGE